MLFVRRGDPGVPGSEVVGLVLFVVVGRAFWTWTPVHRPTPFGLSLYSRPSWACRRKPWWYAHRPFDKLRANGW